MSTPQDPEGLTDSSPEEDISRFPGDVRVLQLIEQLSPDLFRSIPGDPCIRLPQTGAACQGDHWPLRSQGVKAWIAETGWRRIGILLSDRQIDLSDRQIDRIVNVLEGMAWNNPRTESEVTDALDADPLFEAVFIYLHERGDYVGNCSKLLRELCKTAQLNDAVCKF